MLKYAEDFKYNPSLRNKVSELRLAIEQEGEEEMLAMVGLDQWYVCIMYLFLVVCVRTCVHAYVYVRLMYFIIFTCISSITVQM